MYAYLDEKIVVVLLQVCWRYGETTDFVLLRELRLLRLRSSAFVCGSSICLVIKLEVANYQDSRDIRCRHYSQCSTTSESQVQIF